jgi:GrpB-like predicted nucleotidyltransferase (UPF0157 family)
LSSEPIELHQPDADWPAAFTREHALLLGAFDPPPLAIEHMGSTAVPGLPAKPVIDIIVLVEDLDQGRAAIPALETLGYSFWAANPDKAKLFLAKGLPPAPRRTHNLHIHADLGEVRRHLLFRDHLRSNAAARAAYLALKQDLARRFRDDREAYTEGKTAFIDAIVAKLEGPLRP